MSTDWMGRAACAGLPVEWFLAERRGASYHHAKTVCADCPVAAPCLAEAQGMADQYGLRAGLNPRQRQHLRAAS